MKNYNVEYLRSEINRISLVPVWKQRKAFIYGSQVYGTAKSYSDTDILLVAAADIFHKEWKTNEFNIHLYTPDVFSEMLFENHILALECVFAPEEAKIFQEENCKFEINISKLIKKTMSLSQNSWHGAKFKINQGDFDRGLKSLFHSIRMLNFANQIINNGKILDYSSCNDLFFEISSFEETKWNLINKKFIYYKLKEEKELLSHSGKMLA